MGLFTSNKKAIADYRASEQFKQDALDYFYSQQSKPNHFEVMEFAFVDSKGQRYYRYSDDTKMPIKRMEQLQRVQAELESRVSRKELELFLYAFKKIIDSAMNDRKTIGTQLARADLLIEELRKRDDLFHEELFFSLVSIVYIREDQDPSKWDDELESEKIAQFKFDSQGGLRDFFTQIGLGELLPFSNMSAKD